MAEPHVIEGDPRALLAKRGQRVVEAAEVPRWSVLDDFDHDPAEGNAMGLGGVAEIGGEVRIHGKR